MVKSCSPEDHELTTGIRIEVDSDMDDRLEAWADSDGRSKREHARHLLRELLAAYDKDPLILHRLALATAGAGRFVPA